MLLKNLITIETDYKINLSEKKPKKHWTYFNFIIDNIKINVQEGT